MPSRGEQLIRSYYDCINARRLADGARLVADDCEFHHVATRERARGPQGFVALVSDWLRAAPDVTLLPEHIETLGSGRFRVALRVRGHLDGPFELGPSSVGGDGRAFDFVAIHELTIRGNRVAASWLTFERDDFLG